MAVVWKSSDATSDLLDIYLYTARSDRSPEGADRLLRAIDDACQLCAENPQIGTSRPDLGKGLRVFSCGTRSNPRGWVIIYRPINEGIELVRVFRGSRDYPSLF